MSIYPFAGSCLSQQRKTIGPAWEQYFCAGQHWRLTLLFCVCWCVFLFVCCCFFEIHGSKSLIVYLIFDLLFNSWIH